jgi:hypothetical protein
LNRTLSAKLRMALFIAARSAKGTPTPSRVVTKLAENDPELYRQWCMATPSAEARLVYTKRVLNPGGAPPRRRISTAATAVWPIGSIQRWDIEVSLGHFQGPAPEDLPGRLYLHNFGTEDATDVFFTFAEGYLEYIPRIAPRESVEVDWPMDGIADRLAAPGAEHDSVYAKIAFTIGGKSLALEGVLYVQPNELPSFIQELGPPDSPDRVRDIR